jgi:hypothetical protein
MNHALGELGKSVISGLTAQESAAPLSKPVHTVRAEFRLAQAWLRREMEVRRPDANPAFFRRVDGRSERCGQGGHFVSGHCSPV